MLPSQFAKMYAQLTTRLYAGDGFGVADTPILRYLQAGRTETASNGALALKELNGKLGRAKGAPAANAPTFVLKDFTYIRSSINRSFIGKATPWELQETLQLASHLGLVSRDNAATWCRKNLGVDCGGFVAAFWGVGVPHLNNLQPWGSTGILPRGFWDNGPVWSDARKRRRRNYSTVRPGDAAIFFKDVLDDDPDKAKKRDAKGNLIPNTGSEAFHIGVVESANASPSGFTELVVTESAGNRKTSFGGDGVDVRTVSLAGSGTTKGGWVYAREGKNQIFFVEPPAWAGPETAYTWRPGDP